MTGSFRGCERYAIAPRIVAFCVVRLIVNWTYGVGGRTTVSQITPFDDVAAVIAVVCPGAPDTELISVGDVPDESVQE